MNTGKKVLVLGGTGAMGTYLVPELAEMGYSVHVISLDEKISDDPRIRYTKGNAMDEAYITEVLTEHYDAIVDFMIYSTDLFRERHKILLRNTDHYIFLSSYRVYDESPIITEDSPQLWDTKRDAELAASDDYAIRKSRGEDILEQSEFKNWTVVRPAITYSQRRFQLVVLEANILVERMREGKTVILPEEAMDVQATMTWAGDVAKMLARLILNPKAMCDYFTVSTSEHRTWREVAEYYREKGMNYITVSTDDFMKILVGEHYEPRNIWQLKYDRLFNRVVDNRKVLEVTGLKQKDFKLLRDGLHHELDQLPADYHWPLETYIEERKQRMDAYLKKRGLE